MKPLILIVEDEPPLQKLLAYNLEAAGFAVAQAYDGEEAPTLIDERAPDLVLLDWMLPQLSGLELCRRLRRRAGHRASADHHADRARRGAGPAARPRHRCRRLHHQAVLAGRADRAHPRRAAPGAPGLRRAAAELPRPAHGPRRRIGSSAASARSISARPSSACCATSSSIPAACSAAPSCSTGSGAPTSRSSCAPSTPPSAACAGR